MLYCRRPARRPRRGRGERLEPAYVYGRQIRQIGGFEIFVDSNKALNASFALCRELLLLRLGISMTSCTRHSSASSRPRPPHPQPAMLEPFGLTSFGHTRHRSRRRSAGTSMAPGRPETSTTALCPHSHVASIERTPFSRMFWSVIAGPV